MQHSMAFAGQQSLHCEPELALARLSEDPVQTAIKLSESPFSIVADVRLDDRFTLAQELGISAEKSDEYLILRAYEKWGLSCPSRLTGDFAFCLWDSQRQCLFAARDFVGARPFYYSVQQDSLRFSSQLLPLVARTEGAWRLDFSFLKADLSHWNYYDSVRTHYRGIHKLPPGHFLVWQSGNLQTHRYWRPEDVKPFELNTPDDYARQLRQLVEQAVKDRLRNSAAAAHMSGGLDSTAIAALAARENRITGFSWSPAPTSALEGDEREMIELASQRENIPVLYCPRTFDPTTLTLDRTTHPVNTLCPVIPVHARKLGVRTVLSGYGGDEIASSLAIGYLPGLLKQGQFHQLFQQVSAELRERGEYSPRRFLRRLLGIVLELAPKGIRSFVHGPRRAPGLLAKPPRIPSFLDRELGNRLYEVQALPSLVSSHEPGLKANMVRKARLASWASRLESWSWHGSQYGVVFSYPLLDKRVVEFCLAIPESLHYTRGRHRYLFRTAMRGALPDELLWGPLGKKEPGKQAYGRRLRESELQQFREFMVDKDVHPLVDKKLLLNYLEAATPESKIVWFHGVWLAFLNPRSSF